MTDCSQHRYKDLLEYIQKGCQQLGEDRDFAKYLLSMEQAESVEKLIKTYNTIYKLISAVRFESRTVPYGWYVPEKWGTKYESMIYDLNNYLNESILKWFEKQENPTAEQYTCCLANLRESNNINTINHKLIQCNNFKGIDKASEIESTISHHFSLRKNTAQFYKGDLKVKQYISDSQFLAGHGRIFDIAEISFGGDNGISYDNYAEEYWQEVESKKQRIELEEQRKEKEKQLKKTKAVIFGAIVVLLLLVVIFLFAKIGLLGLIIIVGFIFGLPDIIKMGGKGFRK